jgi:hypothetical protein
MRWVSLLQVPRTISAYATDQSFFFLFFRGSVTRTHFDSYSSIFRRKRCIGEWLPERHVTQITQQRGKLVSSMGCIRLLSFVGVVFMTAN